MDILVQTKTAWEPREIELLLVIPILLTILLLAAAALKLGSVRLANVFSAENNAYQQVTTGQNVQVAVNPAPLDGIALIRPVLPNHFDESLPAQIVAFPSGLINVNPVSLSDQAVFLDPTWHYANWPPSDDRLVLRSWFENYLAEDHPSDVTDGYCLGLQPPWPP